MKIKSAIRYIGCLFIILFSCNNSQNNNALSINSYLQEDNVYLLFRGTNSKEGLVARSYNTLNPNVSHVGILLFSDKKWLVHHISEDTKQKSALRSNSINEFLDCNTLKIDYVAISNVNANYNCVKKTIINLQGENIVFDWQFSLTNEENKLYCSEFVVRIIESCTSEPKIQSVTIKLNPLHSLITSKDSLDCYPVDILINNEHTSLIKEWYFDCLHVSQYYQ